MKKFSTTEILRGLSKHHQRELSKAINLNKNIESIRYILSDFSIKKIQYLQSFQEITQEEQKREKQINLNYAIIENEKIPLWRRYLAIYRLYRYYDIIADSEYFSKEQVKAIIGKVFAKLCLSNDSCVFKKYLSR